MKCRAILSSYAGQSAKVLVTVIPGSQSMTPVVNSDGQDPILTDQLDEVSEYIIDPRRLLKNTDGNIDDSNNSLAFKLFAKAGSKLFSGEFESTNSNLGPTGPIKRMPYKSWLKWLRKLLIDGIFDTEYNFTLVDTGDNLEFVVSKKVKGLPKRMFCITMKELSDETADYGLLNIEEHLILKYEDELRYKAIVKRLIGEKNQLEVDLRASIDSYEQFKASLKRQQEMIYKTVIPLVNEKKLQIRELLLENRQLKDEYGIKPVERFDSEVYTSIRKDTGILINSQLPLKPIKFEYDEKDKDQLLKEILEASPRKRRRAIIIDEKKPVLPRDGSPVRKKTGVKSREEVDKNNETESDATVDDTIKDEDSESLTFGNPKLKFNELTTNLDNSQSDELTEDEESEETTPFLSAQDKPAVRKLSPEEGSVNNAMNDGDDDLTQSGSGSETELDE